MRAINHSNFLLRGEPCVCTFTRQAGFATCSRLPHVKAASRDYPRLPFGPPPKSPPSLLQTDLDPSTFESRASSILIGLGFDSKTIHKRTCDMSGGWRMRVGLARALFVKPAMLLLVSRLERSLARARKKPDRR